MKFQISLIGVLLLGSATAWKSDAGYGLVVIVLGLLFITIIEVWNNKNKKPPKDDYTNENGLGV